MVGNGWFVVGNRSKFGWLFLALFYKGERNIHDWILGGKKFRCACFWEGLPVTRLGNFNEQFLDNENLHGWEIGGLCGFLGQFCVILHLKFQTKNWEFFMEHHLQKFNKSTKCDPKIITYFILDSKISSVLSAVLILAPYRKLISTTAVLEFLIRRWKLKADIGA